MQEFLIWFVPVVFVLIFFGKWVSFVVDRAISYALIYYFFLVVAKYINNEGKARSPQAIFNGKAIPLREDPITSGDYLIYNDGVRAGFGLYWSLNNITIVVYNPRPKTIIYKDSREEHIKGSELTKQIGLNFANAHIIKKCQFAEYPLHVQDKILSHSFNKENCWIGYFSGAFEFKNPNVKQLEIDNEAYNVQSTNLRQHVSLRSGDVEGFVASADRVASSRKRSVFDWLKVKESDESEEEKSS